jgi:hypothetical protein
MNNVLRKKSVKKKAMLFAPANEQGVVLLFGQLARELGFEIEVIGTRFPDCRARRHGKLCRIEFEYRASNYEGHGPRGADIIVCWNNDWEVKPRKNKHLEILSLKRAVGGLPRVYVVGCRGREHGEAVDTRSVLDWSVPKNAETGDLVVMYRTLPAAEIRDLWGITGNFYTDPDWGRQADMKLLTRLKKPLTYADLRRDKGTRNIGVVRKRFMGKTDITTDWPLIYDQIVKRNPGAKQALKSFTES